MSDALALIVVLGGLVCGAVVASVAKDRGRDPFGWGVYGFVFGLIALVHIMCLSRREEPPQPVDEAADRWMENVATANHAQHERGFHPLCRECRALDGGAA